jgi:hypothetical protein
MRWSADGGWGVRRLEVLGAARGSLGRPAAGRIGGSVRDKREIAVLRAELRRAVDQGEDQIRICQLDEPALEKRLILGRRQLEDAPTSTSSDVLAITVPAQLCRVGSACCTWQLAWHLPPFSGLPCASGRSLWRVLRVDQQNVWSEPLKTR